MKMSRPSHLVSDPTVIAELFSRVRRAGLGSPARVVVMPHGFNYHLGMHSKRPNVPPSYRRETRRPSDAAPFERLAQRPLCPEEGRRLPKVVAKGPVWHPFLFRRQLGDFDPSAQPGDLVEIVSTSGATQGFGLFNPKAEISVRLLRPGINRGMAFSRPCVYGWRGFLKSSSVSASSTIRPRYMTATRSQRWRTTARL